MEGWMGRIDLAGQNTNAHRKQIRLKMVKTAGQVASAALSPGNAPGYFSGRCQF